MIFSYVIIRFTTPRIEFTRAKYNKKSQNLLTFLMYNISIKRKINNLLSIITFFINNLNNNTINPRIKN